MNGRGMALPVTLALLAGLALLSVAAARQAQQSERAARNDRDRVLALRAAELALEDAQRELERALAAAAAAEALAPRAAWLADPAPPPPACGEALRGLCGEGGGAAFLREPDLGAAYGSATGRVLQTGAGGLPAALPRYAIEKSADGGLLLSAVGYGARPGVRAALQAEYRRSGRVRQRWRERQDLDD